MFPKASESCCPPGCISEVVGTGDVKLCAAAMDDKDEEEGMEVCPEGRVGGR